MVLRIEPLLEREPTQRVLGATLPVRDDAGAVDGPQEGAFARVSKAQSGRPATAELGLAETNGLRESTFGLTDIAAFIRHLTEADDCVNEVRLLFERLRKGG